MALDKGETGEALKELRDEFEQAENEWAEIREEGAKDIRALTPEGTWDENDRKAREEAMRPCLHLDELSQYVNQLINDARASKRAIEVNPAGAEGSDAQARFLANLIRQIEYRSNAQQAYTSMFEDAVQRSYGFLRITTKYVQDRVDEPAAQSFEQEIRIESVVNPDLVTPDPYALRPDLSDMKFCWIRESWSKAEFTRRFPDAEVKDFGHDAHRIAGARWVAGERIWVGERWSIETKPKKLVLLPGPDPNTPEIGAMAVWKDTIPKDAWATVKETVLRERTVDQPYVCQKITNGLEVLKKTDWPGKYIPIVGCLGKVLWVKEGGTSKRQILSLIRLARDPQQLYDYYRTTEAEFVGQAPRFPYFTYEGQLDAAQEILLQKSTREPVAVIKVKPEVDGARGTVLPFPQRNPSVDGAAIQALSLGAEDSRRAIQAAIGSGFLPTQAQRKNEKSGVALKQIETSAQKGSFHFIDHYEAAIRQCGVILADLIPPIYDTARDIHVRKPDDTTIHVRINDPQAQPSKEYGEPIDTTKGEFDVTLSTGPSYESERDKASEFVDTVITGRPETFMWYADLLFKLKNLGPIGEEMAKRAVLMLPPQIQQALNGQQPIPPQIQQQMAQTQMQLQEAMQMVQELQRALETEQVKGHTQLEIKKLEGHLKLALKELEGEQKLQLAKVQIAHDVLDREDEQKHDMAMAAAEAGHASEQAERAADVQKEQGVMNHVMAKDAAKDANNQKGKP